MLGTIALGTMGVSIINSVFNAVHEHEEAHHKVYKRYNINSYVEYFHGDDGKFSFKKLILPSCNARSSDVAKLSVDQVVEGLEAGYKKNYKTALITAGVTVGLFALELFGYAQTGGQTVVSELLKDAMVVTALFGFGKFIVHGLQGLSNQVAFLPFLDGQRVKAIKKQKKVYEKDPSIENRVKLEVTKLIGDYEKMKYDVVIKDNMATIHSQSKGVDYNSIILVNEDGTVVLKHAGDVEYDAMLDKFNRDNVTDIVNEAVTIKNDKNNEDIKQIKIQREREYTFTEPVQSKSVNLEL